MKNEYEEAPNGVRFQPTAANMSLRDYFAAMAMQGIFASGMVESANQAGIDPGYNEQATAFSAYAMADAMIAERDKAK